MYQDIYDQAKMIIKKDACMKFYDAFRALYLEIDASGVGFGAILLQVREGMNCRCDEVPNSVTLHPIAFSSKILSGAKWHYSNIEWEVHRILHGLEKFHHYCFAKDVCVLNDYKPLVAIISKDVAMLSQHL